MAYTRMSTLLFHCCRFPSSSQSFTGLLFSQRCHCHRFKFPHNVLTSAQPLSLFDSPKLELPNDSGRSFKLFSQKFGGTTVAIGLPIPTFGLHKLSRWLEIQYYRLFYDPSFILDEFIKGSYHALEVISLNLQRNNFDALRSMLDAETSTKVEHRILCLDEENKKRLAVTEADVVQSGLHSLCYRIDSKGAIYVDMLMVYDCLRNKKEQNNFGSFKVNVDELQGEQDIESLIKKGLQSIMEFTAKNQVHVNLCFSKRLKPDLQEDWIVNAMNIWTGLELPRFN